MVQQGSLFVQAVCIGPVGKQGSKQHRKSELSVKPALIAAASDGKSVSKAAKAMASLRSLKRGSTVHGYACCSKLWERLCST